MVSVVILDSRVLLGSKEAQDFKEVLVLWDTLVQQVIQVDLGQLVQQVFKDREGILVHQANRVRWVLLEMLE